MKVPSSQDIVCLLVHGLNGIRYDFDEIAQVLRDHGYATNQLLLPGHEVQAREARQYGWNDWAESLQRRYEDLQARHARVVVIGHSMGGTLALNLAEREPRVTALVTLCAPTNLHASLPHIVRFGRYILPYLPIMSEDISDPNERQYYRRRKVSQWMALAPLHTLLQVLPLVRANLRRVRCPALVVAARNDHVVPFRDAYTIYEHIASRHKQLVILEKSWHVVTRDVESDLVADHILRFLRQLDDDTPIMEPPVQFASELVG